MDTGSPGAPAGGFSLGRLGVGEAEFLRRFRQSGAGYRCQGARAVRDLKS